MNVKAEAEQAENLFYVFVCLPQRGAPSFYVVPRNVVARQVHEDHKTMAGNTRSRGRAHRDNPNRLFNDSNGDYKERWDLLGLD
jgi:hypothetical protein